jgi:hypothetical protein
VQKSSKSVDFTQGCANEQNICEARHHEDENWQNLQVSTVIFREEQAGK